MSVLIVEKSEFRQSYVCRKMLEITSSELPLCLSVFVSLSCGPVTSHKCGREEILKFVKGLYGFGDYAAGNVVMLLGFYEGVPMDSETVSGGVGGLEVYILNRQKSVLGVCT